jgi:nucleoside-diphosphate-sugar epimerase
MISVLVTGGAGYVGSHLVDVLEGAGHAVRVLDLRPAGGERVAGRGRECVQGSVADANLVARAVRGVEGVYHLAWGFYAADEGRELREGLMGTLTLLQAALEAGVRHLLFASTAVVYGPTGPRRVGEEHPCHPERSAIGGPVYGIAKLACEGLCLAYGRRGLPATVLRMHGVFGEGRLAQFGQMIAQAQRGEPVVAIRGAGGEYVHLDDAVRALLLAMGDRRTYGQVFNLAGAHTYHDAELARSIVEAAGSQSPLELVEDPAQEMISVSVDKLRRVLGYAPEKGEFLSGLIRCALGSVKRET